MVFSDEEESGEVVATSAERRDTATSSAGDELVAGRRAADPSSRKRTASTDIIGERAPKRTQSPRRLAALPTPSPPVVDVAEQGGRSAEGWSDTRTLLGSVPMHDSRRGEDLPAVGVAEHVGQSKGWTGARVPRESQSEDNAPVAPVEDSRAGGRDDPQVGQEPVGTTLPPTEIKERGSRSRSGPRCAGASRLGLSFRVVPLATRGLGMPGMSIASTIVQETWKLVLQRVAMARPFVPGMVPSGSAVDEATAMASVLAMIPVPMATVASEVTLATEARDTELPALSGRWSRGLPLLSEPKAPGEDVAGTGSGSPAAAQANKVVEIPSDDEADVPVEPSVPLRQPTGDVTAEPLVPSQGLAVVQSVARTSGGPVVSMRDLAVAQLEARPFGEVPEGDLEWPCPEHPANARFVLRDSQERQLWDIFGGQGHVAVSELTKLTTQLESAWKRALFARQLVEGNMQLVAEEIRKTSSHKSHFLRSKYARMAELERRAESACREARDRTVEAAAARAEG
ncbi:uncharacterized protein [Miscanthus floridulus]|uniref:uncharacterized protein n=1 Tax=Miscanthus floridulus TaxID=154761 RepID=UPI003459DDE4